MIKQLKYTISEVSKILGPLNQTYFPRRIWSRGTRILLTPSMVYFNCILLLVYPDHFIVSWYLCSYSLSKFFYCRSFATFTVPCPHPVFPCRLCVSLYSFSYCRYFTTFKWSPVSATQAFPSLSTSMFQGAVIPCSPVSRNCWNCPSLSRMCTVLFS